MLCSSYVERLDTAKSFIFRPFGCKVSFLSTASTNNLNFLGSLESLFITSVLFVTDYLGSPCRSLKMLGEAKNESCSAYGQLMLGSLLVSINLFVSLRAENAFLSFYFGELKLEKVK